LKNFADYARYYDPLYQDKDYLAECDMIEAIFRTHGKGLVSSVLDLGSGTGNHAIPLAKRGYEVSGLDCSEAMLTIARSKVANISEAASVVFYQGDIRSFELKQRFDAALMMFAVLGYQLENTDVLSSLRVARQHLKPEGLLIFDVWYGPAVLHEKPTQRAKIMPTPKGKILRVAFPQLDIGRHTSIVKYYLLEVEDGLVLYETEEVHRVRFFFSKELELFLDCSGFKLLHLSSFGDINREPDETTWNVLGIAQAH
jgi:SAM-dependent methyltransferase